MIAKFSGLVFHYPYTDLDGTPHPGCDHQAMTTDPVELAVIQGAADMLLKASLPVPFVRVGDKIKTTWGCERNTRKTEREATIDCVELGLYRHPQSMWYRPAYQYIGTEDGRDHRMYLTDIRREDGAEWTLPHRGDWAPFYFRLEWISPITGLIERGDVLPGVNSMVPKAIQVPQKGGQ
jgi:hypothetical protein